MKKEKIQKGLDEYVIEKEEIERQIDYDRQIIIKNERITSMNVKMS